MADKKKKNDLGDILQFLVLVLTTSYVLLTLVIWPFFSMGWYIVALFCLLAINIAYKYIKQHDIKPLQLVYILYLIFLLTYFLIWGQADFGTAFISLFIVLITPIFLLANTVFYMRNLRKK